MTSLWLLKDGCRKCLLHVAVYAHRPGDELLLEYTPYSPARTISMSLAFAYNLCLRDPEICDSEQVALVVRTVA